MNVIGKDIAITYKKLNKSKRGTIIKNQSQIIDFIKLSNTYTELTLDKNIINLPTHKSIHYQEGSIYLSVDLKSGNWQSLKLYDQQNEFVGPE